MNRELRETLDRILLGVESERRPPDAPACGLCRDSGWVDVFDIDAKPRVRRCECQEKPREHVEARRTFR
jgi:hypothetical protein